METTFPLITIVAVRLVPGVLDHLLDPTIGLTLFSMQPSLLFLLLALLPGVRLSELLLRRGDLFLQIRHGFGLAPALRLVQVHPQAADPLLHLFAVLIR